MEYLRSKNLPNIYPKESPDTTPKYVNTNEGTTLNIPTEDTKPPLITIISSGIGIPIILTINRKIKPNNRIVQYKIIIHVIPLCICSP